MALNRTGTKLTVERKFKRYTEQKYSATRLRIVAREIALREIELIRRRTAEGKSRTGSALRPLTDGYLKNKRGIIRNGYKVARGRGKNRRLVSIQPTAFAADRASQFMRLSGRMYSSMYVRDIRVKQKGNDISMTYALDFKGARNKRIAGYHINGKGKRKRDFWGPVKDLRSRNDLKRLFLRLVR